MEKLTLSFRISGLKSGGLYQTEKVPVGEAWGRVGVCEATSRLEHIARSSTMGSRRFANPNVGAIARTD